MNSDRFLRRRERQVSSRPGSADAPIRGEMRSSTFQRVTHGAYRPRRSGLTPDEAFMRDLETFALILPEGAVFTHVTAARILGWSLPVLPEQVPVFAAVRGDNHPSRPGLICSRLTHDAPVTIVDGLPVDSAEEILLRSARDFGVLDLVIMIDSSLKTGDLDPDRMEALLATRRPGVRKLREAYNLSNAKAESAGESLLRTFHEVMGIPVIPQAELFDSEGRLIGRVDLRIRGTPYVQEYDGAHHRQAKQQTTDLRRERGLAGTSYVRRGYTLDDLLNHPAVMMHELDRLVGRSHGPARLAKWRKLVAESLYSEAGRARIVNRWRRHWGGHDWSETA